MLRWDTKTQSSIGKGILGTVLAFFGADKEQGHKTIHQHWQILDKSFQPSPQLASYMDKIRKFGKDMLEKRQEAISKTFSS